MDIGDHEILTIEEAAQYLRLPVSTVYRLAQAGRIPAQKVGRQWRFYLPSLTQYVASKGFTLESTNSNKNSLDFS